MKSTIIARILRIGLSAAFCAGVCGLLSAFFWLDWYLKYFGDLFMVQENYRMYLLCFLYAVGILVLWIIAELVLMLRTVTQDPFVRRNSKALRRMGVVAIVCGGLFFLKCIQYFTPLTLICGGAFVLCGLFSLTLSGLFARAVEIKEENDLTI